MSVARVAALDAYTVYANDMGLALPLSTDIRRVGDLETAMARRREDMIAGTRTKLIAAARRAFAAHGYVASAMEDITAAAGLTRGALYHHFDSKRGLLEAVIAQIDDEMNDRLAAVVDRAETRWQGFLDELATYVQMASEPEIQRIILLDGPAILGDPAQWNRQMACVRTTQRSLELLVEEGTIGDIDAASMARLISAAALSGSLSIAAAEDPRSVSRQVVESLVRLVSGLKSVRRP